MSIRLMGYLVPVLGLASACAPTRYALPIPEMTGGGSYTSPWGAAEVHVEQLTPDTIAKHPRFAVKIVPPKGPPVFVPRVPLPSFAVAITNLSAQPLRLSGGRVWLSDGAGQRYDVLTDRHEIIRRAIDQAKAEYSELTSYVVLVRDPSVVHPLAAIRDAAEEMPVLGGDLIIDGGATWNGAIVIAADATQLETLSRTLRSGELLLHIDGASQGSGPLPTLTMSFRTPGPKSTPDCLAEYHYRLNKFALIDGRKASQTDISRVLLGSREARDREKRAWALKTAGWVLVGTGAASAVGVPGAIASSGNSSLAPAGLGMLGLSAIGIGLVAGGQREHNLAVRAYNDVAAKGAVCARPL